MNTETAVSKPQFASRPQEGLVIEANCSQRRTCDAIDYTGVVAKSVSPTGALMCFSTSQPRSLRSSPIPGFRPRPQEGQFLCQPQLRLNLVPFSISRHLIRAISKNILSSQFSSNLQCGGLRLLIQSRFPSQKLVRRFPNGRHRSPPGQAGLDHRSACTHAISFLGQISCGHHRFESVRPAGCCPHRPIEFPLGLLPRILTPAKSAQMLTHPGSENCIKTKSCCG